VRGRTVGFAKGYRAREAIIEVGRLIREHRKAADLNQSELAELAGLTQSEISRLEGGSMVRGAGVEILNRVAAALGMRLDVTLSPLSEPTAKERRDSSDAQEGRQSIGPAIDGNQVGATRRVDRNDLACLLKSIGNREMPTRTARQPFKALSVTVVATTPFDRVRRFSSPVRPVGVGVGRMKMVLPSNTRVTVIVPTI